MTKKKVPQIPKAPDGFMEYVNDCKAESYVFFKYNKQKNENNYYSCYCTECQEEFILASDYAYLKHNERNSCSECSSAVTYKDLRYGRKKLKETVVAVYFRVIRGKIFIVRNYVYIDYYDEKGKQNYNIITDEMMVIGKKHRALYHKSRYSNKIQDWGSSSSNSFSYIHSAIYGPAIITYYYTDNITKEFLMKTNNRYLPITYEKFKTENNERSYGIVQYIQFLWNVHKITSIEHLYKCGYEKIALDIGTERITYKRTINTKANNFKECFKDLNKTEIKRMKRIGLDDSIDAIDFFTRNKNKFKDDDMMKFYYANFNKKMTKLKHHNLKKLYNYLCNQSFKWDCQPDVYVDEDMLEPIEQDAFAETMIIDMNIGVVCSDYIDYMNDLVYLSENIKNTRLQFPVSLQEAHEESNIKANELRKHLTSPKQLRLKYYTTSRILKELDYENNGLFIKPIILETEKKREGNALNHCVDSERYTKNVISKSSFIFKVRKVSAPREPYYTLELDKNGDIIQCRSSSNKSKSDDITKFINEWREKVVMPNINVLKAKKTKNKIKKAS